MDSSEKTIDFFVGVYKLSTHVGTISKFFAPVERHEASSKRRTHKFHALPYTVESQWWPGSQDLCSPALLFWQFKRQRVI